MAASFENFLLYFSVPYSFVGSVDRPFLHWLLLTCATVAVSLGFYIYWFHAKFLHDANFAFWSYLAGFKRRSVKLPGTGITMSYLERGSPHNQTVPSVLLVHGFTSAATHWSEFLVYFGHRHTHVIAVDLPGHGESDTVLTRDLSIPGLVDILHEFVVATNLTTVNHKKIDIVGVSLGGSLSGCFAAQYPELVNKVCLMCPAGIEIEASVKSDFVALLDQPNPRNLFTPTTVEEFREMVSFSFVKTPYIPHRIMMYLTEESKRRKPFFDNMLTQLLKEETRYRLQEVVHNMSMPLCVIWGKQDKILDISCLEKIRPFIPHAQITVLEDAGHGLYYEYPRRTALLVRAFLYPCSSSSSS